MSELKRRARRVREPEHRTSGMMLSEWIVKQRAKSKVRDTLTAHHGVLLWKHNLIMINNRAQLVMQ